MILLPDRLSPTPTELAAIEEKELAALGGVLMVWTGRAATALQWAYRVAKHVGSPTKTPEIIVPAISCVSPAAAVLSAGCKVRFADVDPRSGMITVDSVRERWNASTRAVVCIHLYGQTAEAERLADWCREHDVVLIEDLAQAQGATFPNGRLAGSIGDIVVYSFNPTKILECGGGALIVRSQKLADAWSELAHVQDLGLSEIENQTASLLALSQRNLYHALILLRRIRPEMDAANAFLYMRNAYSGLYIKSMQNSAKLAAAWESLPGLLEARRVKAEVYSRKLAGGPWRLLEGWRSSGVCWRYSLLFDFHEHALALTEAVRRDGFYVSNLYWPLSDLLNQEDVCPNAQTFGRRIINLWVDQSVETEWVERCAESLSSHALFCNPAANAPLTPT